MTTRRAKRRLLFVLCLGGMLSFTALGVWQVERRSWKLDLIERVEARVTAAPVAAPAVRDWTSHEAAAAEYRRVRARGVWLHDRETLVDALTDRGGGYWVVTPLRTGSGTILVNRGFVPPDRASPASRRAGQQSGPVDMVGLLRLTEPGGRFLRPNRARAGRFYSRDVAAIAAARRLGEVAPYFIDADDAPNPGGWPIGGLTVVTFRNTHLVYALTWFALAALSAAGLVLLRKGAH